MSTKHQKVTIEIPKRFSSSEREAIGQAIVDFIRERTTEKNLDKKNRPFPGYSESYIKSLNFKTAGKSKSEINLTQSGDMLGALDVLSTAPGKVTVGFEAGTEENAIADGNIRGTYGQDRPVGPKRDFLGLTKTDLKNILKTFESSEPNAARRRRTQETVQEAFDRILGSRNTGVATVLSEEDEIG